MAAPVPAHRVNGLVQTEAADGVLVYDQERHHIHHLDPVSATVWRMCDGRRNERDIAIASGMSETAVRLALAQLANANLLDSGYSPVDSSARSSRRNFLRKAGIATAIPTVVSMTAPFAAQATSPGSGYYQCSDVECDRLTSCSEFCTSTSICPPQCIKTSPYSCMSFDGVDGCAVYCDCVT
ncbi:MAG TPA: PqqD family protein [Thermomicrobiales bacterium]|nr:PqqD family protein [Thermomicrobiales bacterium]